MSILFLILFFLLYFYLNPSFILFHFIQVIYASIYCLLSIYNFQLNQDTIMQVPQQIYNQNIQNQESSYLIYYSETQIQQKSDDLNDPENILNQMSSLNLENIQNLKLSQESLTIFQENVDFIEYNQIHENKASQSTQKKKNIKNDFIGDNDDQDLQEVIQIIDKQQKQTCRHNQNWINNIQKKLNQNTGQSFKGSQNFQLKIKRTYGRNCNQYQQNQMFNNVSINRSKLINRNFLPRRQTFNFSNKEYQNFYAQQNSIFKNVLITIKLGSIYNLRKKILLMPFSQINFEDQIKNDLLKGLQYNIREIIYKEMAKSNQHKINDGYTFAVKAKGLERNFAGLFLLKSPSKKEKYLKYYQKEVLKVGIRNMMDKLDKYQQSSIVIPDFEWGRLERKEIYKELINQIFGQVHRLKHQFRCENLRQIHICTENSENFGLLAGFLRNYVRQLQ